METAWDRIGLAGQVSHICAADVAQVISQLEKLPLPIGHSMGGLVVQKYLESDYQILAAVLLASFPPSGVIRTTLRIALQHPTAIFLKANATLKLYPIVGTPELTREAFFIADRPEEKVSAYFDHIQIESYRGKLDMMLLKLPRHGLVKTLMLVLGAAYDMKLETGWQLEDDRILGWLEEQGM